jgi:excisionase family DNA binding protein
MKLYDVRNAAQVLSVSPWTVRAYIRNGKLPAIRMGRLVRLTDEDLSQFILSAKSRPTTEQNHMRTEDNA